MSLENVASRWAPKIQFDVTNAETIATDQWITGQSKDKDGEEISAGEPATLRSAALRS